MNLSDITIVITTYKRYGCLLTLLNYYLNQKSSINIIILDSTPNPTLGKDLKNIISRKNIVYKIFDERVFVSQKIAQGIQDIKTKYVVLCADDDFLFMDGLNSSIDFLEANKEYASCHGIYFNHYYSCNTLTLKRIYPYKKILQLESNLDRVAQYLSGVANENPFYAVHRSLDFKKIWNLAGQGSSDWGLSEILPSALSLAMGKMMVLPIPYGSREPNTITWMSAKKITEIYEKKKVRRAIAVLSFFMKKEFNITLSHSKKYFIQCLNIYIEAIFLKYSKINYWKILRPKINIRIRFALSRSEYIGQKNANELSNALSIGKSRYREINSIRSEY